MMMTWKNRHSYRVRCNCQTADELILKNEAVTGEVAVGDFELRVLSLQRSVLLQQQSLQSLGFVRLTG